MLMTLGLSIKIPRHMDNPDKLAEEAKSIYELLMVTHLVILTVKFLRQYLAYTHFMLYRAMLMGSLFLQLFAMNYVLGRWNYS